MGEKNIGEFQGRVIRIPDACTGNSECLKSINGKNILKAQYVR